VEGFSNVFSIEKPEKDMKEISLFVKNNIFPDNLRPTHWGFLVLLHYPNQLLLASTSKQYIWDPQTSQNDYEMRIYAKNMEVYWRRRKCLDNWKNYDTDVLEFQMNRIGCRPFYLNSISNLPLCKDQKDVQDIVSATSMDANHDFVPPCKATEKINYKYELTEVRDDVEGSGKFWCTFIMQDTRFKVTY
jgi:hypothetical protein